MSDKILTWKEAIKLYPKINSTPLDAFDKVTIEEVLFTLDTGAEFTAPLSLNIDNPENIGLFDIRLIDFRADNFDLEKAKSEITFKELKAGSNILLDESDGLITISSTVDGDQLLNEVLDGNTEERISVNYTGGKLNFVVEDNLSAYTNDVGFLSSVSWGDLTGNYSISQNGGNITGSIDVSNGTFSLFSPASFGEPNTASNQGTLGIGIFDNKNVWDLEFRNLNSLSSAITLALDVGNKNINLDLVETNINHDNLSGYVANEHIDWSVDQLGTVIHPNNYVQSSVTQEQVQDFAWSVLTGTQSLITVTYLDGSNQVSFVVEPNLSNYNNDAGFLTSIPASYVQAGENISQLVNDAGYITTDTNDIDYVSNVQLVGSNLTFTGIGNAFNSTVDLSSLSVAETDPVFSASPAAGITAPDITNWNNAFSWGDHSLAGYLTAIPITYLQSGDNVSELINDAGYLTSFSETDPVFTASQAFNITAGDITNLSNLSGVNTGDQTTIVGITGTKAQFNTAVTDGDFLFVGDITDTNDIDYINGSTFVGGLLTLTGVGNAGTSISLDGRYLQSEVNDLTASVTWANVPDINITQSSVTQHQGALSITESQISDLGNYLEAADINTLAELNAILTDATLIDTTDSRLSDARNPLAHTHVVADITDFPTLPVISDVAYNSTTWNNNLDGASKNAIRDKIDAMDTTIAANTAKVSFPGFTSLLADYGFVDNSTNWNNAFSWGDHALEGYLTSADLSGYVQTTNIDTLAELNAIVTDATLASQAWVTGQGYLTSFTEVNDLSAAVVWANIPDANVPETAVTQHQAALTITESQISDLGNYSVVGHTHNLSNITDITATAAEVNLLDLSLLTAGWVLRATTANTAAWGQLNTSDLNNDSGFISSTAGNWAGTFDGQEGTYYLDYNNFTNTPTIPSTLSNLTDVVSATNTNRFVLVANGTTGYVGRALLEADISDLGNYALAGHTHVASDITDFDTEVSNNPDVAANTVKVSFPGFTSLTSDYGVTLATVATSGAYADLSGIPTIPTVSDTAYGAGWNGETADAPSKNAVYDEIESLRTAVNAITQEKGFTILNPSSSEDIPLWRTNKAITITQLSAVVAGTSPGVTYTIRHDPNISDTGIEVVTGGTVVISTSTGTITTSFDDATIPADSWIWIEITGTSGTVTTFNVTLEYTID